MIIKTHPLSVKRQAELLEISRSNVYYLPTATSEKDLALMRAIDELHLEYPFLGARQLRKILAREGHPHAGRLHISTLMAKMGITALYRKPDTSKRHPGHKIYPYLLRHLAIERANQVWAMDITYLPMQRGFIYLAAVMDWATRRVLAWRVSNTLTADSVSKRSKRRSPASANRKSSNTDQGTQFTSDAFTTMLHGHGVAISMDGRGCWRDNVFVERLWRSIKYEEVYLHAYASVSEAKAGISRYLAFYNGRRPHTALGDRTPDEAYFTQQTLKNAA
jgi:putative transposase